MGACKSKSGGGWAPVEVEALEEICDSDELSLELLRAKIHPVPPDCSSDAVLKSGFLHFACANERVTLEVIEFLLDAFPGAAGRRAARGSNSDSDPDEESIDYSVETVDSGPSYPLHLACWNESCPNSVVELLAKEYPPALKDECCPGPGIWGLPLHIYLGRASNMSLSTVKTLVEMHPESLEVPSLRRGFLPIHTFLSNPNISGLDVIARFLAESSRSSLRMVDERGGVPLHAACQNHNMDPNIVRVLLECWPESAFERNNIGYLPLHYLCSNRDLSDKDGTEMVRMLIDRNPHSLTDFTGGGYRSLHLAVSNQSPGFCQALIGDHLEIVQAEAEGGILLPVHQACLLGRLDTVKYLLEILPESINVHDEEGCLPIHRAAMGSRAENARIIEHLLSVDPDGASRLTTIGPPSLPLEVAMQCFGVHIDVVATLFDAFPQAICNTDTLMGRATARGLLAKEVRTFLKEQMRYVNKARDIDALSTLDPDGRLPLHYALWEKASLGAIKLLVKGNPDAVRVADRWGAYPLHIACAYSSAASVVRYLAALDDTILGRRDAKRKNTPLHCACWGANLGVVRCLLESSFVGVSERNNDNKLPIHLLCEVVGGKVDSESQEFVEAVWLLLLAHPETVSQMLDQSDAKESGGWHPNESGRTKLHHK